MKMESAVEAQQGVETAVTETESQQITPAQIATLAQVTFKKILNVHDTNAFKQFILKCTEEAGGSHHF